MITAKTDGIISLLQTSNIVIINALLETGFITIEMLQDVIKKDFKCSDKTTDLDFIAEIIDLLGVIEDKEIIDGYISQFPEYRYNKHNWNDNVLLSFMKLVDLGGTMVSYELIHLPYDAFLYYVEKNEYHVDIIAAGSIINCRSEPKVREWITARFEFDIKLFSLSDLMRFATASVIDDKCLPLVMQETYDRSSFDFLLINVLISGQYCLNTTEKFVDKYVTECYYDQQISLLQSLQIIRRHHKSNINLQDDLVTLREFFKSNKIADAMMQEIFSYQFCNYTNDELQIIASKLNLLMNMCHR